MSASRAAWTLPELDRALIIIGDVVRLHPLGRAAVPIYARLEEERERLEHDEAVAARAMRMSAGAVG